MGVDTFYQYIVTGVVIIIAAYIEIVQGNMLARKKEKQKKIPETTELQ